MAKGRLEREHGHRVRQTHKYQAPAWQINGAPSFRTIVILRRLPEVGAAPAGGLVTALGRPRLTEGSMESEQPQWSATRRVPRSLGAGRPQYRPRPSMAAWAPRVLGA